MSLKGWFKSIAVLLPLAALNVSTASADDGACAGGTCSTMPTGGHCGGPFGCPGPYVHCTPKVPCLKYKSSCGKPLCDLCDVPGYGYYPTCWRPSDQPLYYHCQVPTPTQMVPPPAHAPAPAPVWPNEETTPMPRPSGNGARR
jgi:hypothetical protein